MASPSSTASLSPTQQAASPHDQPAAEASANVPLPRLVGHLIAAKRSLSATAHVERANTLVATARRNIEEIAALSARKSFLQQYVLRELRLVQGLRQRLDAILDKGGDDFRAVLRILDASDARVKQTLHLLKTTTVEPSFQSRQDLTPAQPDTVGTDVAPNPPQDTAKTEPHKCLYDFVSEQGVDDLTQVFRQCIDTTNEATDSFTSSNEAFDAELQAIYDKVTVSSPLESSSHHNRQQQRSNTAGDKTPDDIHPGPKATDPSSTTGSLFRSLESNATETASLLESLVRHYDLCVTALKHTEGGGEAAAQAHAQIDMPGGLAELERDIPHEPISEEERAEMVTVLEKDALEVQDVVQEIRDRAAEMEGQLEILSNKVEVLKSEHASVEAAVRSLDALGRNLPLYIEASTTFLERWTEQKAKIERNLEELEALRDFYDGFLRAYDGLILEIGRRKVLHKKMEKVVSEAMAKVSKLYQEDIDEREAFKLEQGEYLPVDIWPGLVDPPAKFEISQAGQEANELPDVSKEAMQRAMQRHGKRL